MDFNNLPLQTQLQLILNDLASCHVQGTDALKFGTALKALDTVRQACEQDKQETE